MRVDPRESQRADCWVEKMVYFEEPHWVELWDERKEMQQADETVCKWELHWAEWKDDSKVHSRDP